MPELNEAANTEAEAKANAEATEENTEKNTEKKTEEKTEEKTVAEKAPESTEVSTKLEAALAEAEKWKALSRKNESRATEEHTRAGTLEERLVALEKDSQEAQNQAKTAIRDSLIQKAISDARLPEGAAALIRGEDAESIATEIEVLKSLAGTPKEEQNQGFSPDWLTSPNSQKSGQAISEDELFNAYAESQN